MSHLLPPWPTLSAFMLASLVLAITPGPGVLFIVTRSLALGRRAGIVSVLGIALGNLLSALGAAVGLGTLFAASPLVFTLIKYAGAIYLLYLGVQTLRGSGANEPTAAVIPRALPRLFRDGLWVALLNPKTTLFYAAFLPQFIRGDASPVAQSAALGVVFVLVALMSDGGYAIAAGSIRSRMAGMSRFSNAGRWLTGAVFIGLALYAALAVPGAAAASQPDTDRTLSDRREPSRSPDPGDDPTACPASPALPGSRDLPSSARSAGAGDPA
jgi:threonine/homoserine/homoserine lactone efflux protein